MMMMMTVVMFAIVIVNQSNQDHIDDAYSTMAMSLRSMSMTTLVFNTAIMSKL